MGDGPPVVHHPRVAALLRERYAPADLAAIERLLASWGALELPALGNGLYAAVPHGTPGAATSGYASTWVRDTVQVAHCAWERGDLAAVSAAARTLLAWFVSQERRFEDCIAGRADLSDAMQRPHVRFDGLRLAEIGSWWPHAQNDALGYGLWFLARAALAGVLRLDASGAAALWRVARYFTAIRYWQDEDSGHWEEARKLGSSSVGTATAGLVALRGLARSRPEVAGAGAPPGEPRADLDALLDAGRAALDAMLPWESRGTGKPALERRADAALLFLVHPLRVVRGEMAERILAQTREELEGPYGIRRYVGDSYWMADYKRLFDEETRTSGFEDDVASRDRHLLPGSEAQWCLFDPLVSALHGWRYARSRDPSELALQQRHFERALGQVTGPDAAVGEGLCPEAYYLEDSRQPGRWVANDDTPLLWTQALLGSALRGMQNSAALG